MTDHTFSATLKASFRANRLPGLFLWCLGILLLLSWWYWPAAQAVFLRVNALREAYGFRFSVLSTAIAGGLIPFLYLSATGMIPKGKRLAQGVFLVLCWGAKGIELDLLYWGQAQIFGEGTNPLTVATKVAADLFIYNPLWGTPTLTVLYLWNDVDFSFRRLHAGLNRRFFTRTLPCIYISALLVWIPTVTAIYCMPTALQLPLQNIVLCFFVLIVSALSKSGSDVPPSPETPLEPSTCAS